MKKILPIFLLTVLLSFGSLFAADKELLNVVKQNDLLINDTGFIKHYNVCYLVSVGVSEIKANTPKAKVKAIKESRLKANKALMNFVHGTELESKKILKIEEITTMTIKDGKTSEMSVKEKKEYLELIKSKGSGVIKKTIDIGKWKSEDKKEYFYALGIVVSE